MNALNLTRRSASCLNSQHVVGTVDSTVSRANGCLRAAVWDKPRSGKIKSGHRRKFFRLASGRRVVKSGVSNS